MNCDVCKHDIECYEGDCFTNGKACADDYGFVVCTDCLELVSLEEYYDHEQDDMPCSKKMRFVIIERK